MIDDGALQRAAPGQLVQRPAVIAEHEGDRVVVAALRRASISEVRYSGPARSRHYWRHEDSSCSRSEALRPGSEYVVRFEFKNQPGGDEIQTGCDSIRGV